MAFGGLQVTQIGRIKLANAQNGSTLKFTHLAIGDGQYTGSYNDITSLINSLYTVLPSINVHDDIVTLDADITNQNNQQGYYFRELGVWATDGTENFLYAYDNAGLDAEYINSNGNVIIDKRIRLELYISTSANVIVQNSGGLYALKSELDTIDNKKLDKTGDGSKLFSEIEDIEVLSSINKNDLFSTRFGKIKLAITNLINHIANQNNPHTVTKSQIGLGSVDNTSDANKPISNATQTALNGKSSTTHNHSGIYEPVFSKNSAFNKAFGNTAGTVCQGNDSRLSDERTPKLHNHSRSDITDFPTSLPASDVYDWAKAVVKPIYEYGEITGDPPFSNPNLLDNGDFQVWQRGNSFDITERRKYTADRWVAYMNPEEGYVPYTVVNSSRRLKIVSATGGSRFLIYQHKELNNYIIRKILGNKLTLSVKMISGNAQEITTSATVLYNSSDKPSVLLARQAHMISANKYKIMSMTFDIAGDVDFDDVKSLQIIIASACISSDVYIDYAKLELGEIATPDVPRTYAEERMICKRFGRYICVDFTMNAASNSFSNMMSIPVDMRVAPTLTLSVGGTMSNLTGERITYSAFTDHILFSFTASASGMMRVYGRKYWADAEIY